MRCLECDCELERLDHQHLLGCSGLTIHEYAIRHHLPLDLLLSADQINVADDPAEYPSGQQIPDEHARAVLEGLEWAGLLRAEDEFLVIPGEVRRLDLLLWDLKALYGLGFRFRQEFHFDAGTHRVVARNRLKALRSNLVRLDAPVPVPLPPPDFAAALATHVAHTGELHAGYLFLEFHRSREGVRAADELRQRYQVRCRILEAAGASGGVLLRTETIADAQRLLDELSGRLMNMPGVAERFFEPAPHATVVKELVFDSAHFITDHPAKCSNLHGGRYQLHVKVKDRVDPVTGCVVDYGYLKRVVSDRVINRFDHHNLNYVAPELAWRSSTEILCIYIWEQLIDYLPGLSEITLYETPQSWCVYSGPSLVEFQSQGSSRILGHFHGAPSGISALRALIMERPPDRRRVSART